MKKMDWNLIMEKTPLELAIELVHREKETNSWAKLSTRTGLAINTLRSVERQDFDTSEETIYSIIAGLECPTLAWDIARKFFSTKSLTKLVEKAKAFAKDRPVRTPNEDFYDPVFQHILMYSFSGLKVDSYLKRFPNHSETVDLLYESGVLEKSNEEGILVCPFYDRKDPLVSMKLAKARLDVFLAYEKRNISGPVLDMVERVDLEGFLKIRKIIWKAFDEATDIALLHESRDGIDLSMSLMCIAFGLSKEQKDEIKTLRDKENI
ncbi:hypothetical protein [Pseudobacteriovorax antillogorgiicola]|uniref:Uncharacterized protein n=1 Tax=Pseudobacteriovorax antillogorgiicola TaxID=1513793 RepID=A0A1Y6CVM9_9BACT|nr:hypothetical protein [Pseudobacteriovorax antillogorgiicola]TCS44218.1 hypothetical protein EDD56_13418 [Pseudobacteriovorax antillogorgiicola]SMF80484.1 hypothetical protein SAMN06296036_13519 [Pseudobacteriovorax antillogorgiicola]